MEQYHTYATEDLVEIIETSEFQNINAIAALCGRALELEDELFDYRDDEDPEWDNTEASYPPIF